MFRRIARLVATATVFVLTLSACGGGGGGSTGPVLKVGDVFRDCAGCPEMVVLRDGSFSMGSPSSEEGRLDNEGPVHRVRIGYRLAVGRYEVTRGEFGRFVSATGRGMGNSCWLSRETGHEYRLLSESEWEYAARAGTRMARYWGAGASGQCEYANGAASEMSFDWRNEECFDGYERTAPVGVFGENDWGLHDMLGNVWEWTRDCWNDSYDGAPSDGSVWEYGDCSRRVLRGGSWSFEPRSLRAAIRYGYESGIRDYLNGFRVARTLIP